jgi:ferrous iron transport protein A
MSLKLSELSVGASAIIRTLPTQGATFLRLREMGLLPGTRVQFVRTAPLGDPLELQVRGYNLSLRRTEADAIVVEPVV